MSTATLPMPDPAAIIDQLDPAAIRTRLDDLKRQRSAWLVLLRAALARRRSERHRRPETSGTEAKG
jgi:hypothetical protein